MVFSNEASELKEYLVSVTRVSKVVKGGRRFRFSAFVVVGDGKGRVGFGSGKATEVAAAKAKASESAKRSIFRVPLKEGRTIHHNVYGKFCSSRVVIKTAKKGRGVKAGGALRAVFECLGIHDVTAKSLGSCNSQNLVKACFEAFQQLSTPKAVAARRRMKVARIVERREA